MRKGMKKILGLLAVPVLAAILLLPDAALAAGGDASPLVFVADSRRLSGWQAWFANLYNESRLLFTLLSVVLIPLVGMLFGLIAEFVMNRIGLDLKSRELSEH
jgi:hypothetical protein